MDGIAAVLLIPTVSQAKARDSGEVVMPQDKMNRDFFERWGFSEAVIDNDRVYLSGIVAGMRKEETDPTAAFDRAFGDDRRCVGSVRFALGRRDRPD